MLVPLTPSLYVPGKLKNVGSVLVDVGTGYFIEKVRVRERRTVNAAGLSSALPVVVMHLTMCSPAQTATEAKTFYNAKILALRKNVDELQPVIERKQDNLRSVVDVLQHRLTQREREREAEAAA